MTRRGPMTRSLPATLLAVLIVVAGCSGSSGGGSGDRSSTSSSPSASSSGSPAARSCGEIRTGLLDAVQAYVDAYGAPLSGSSDPGSSSGPVVGDESGLRDALGKAQDDLRAADCDLQQFRAGFAQGLDRVTARGPLANAVLLRLTASLTGTLGTTPSTVRLRPRDDLARRLSQLAPGSTARLAPGRYRLRAPLVLLSGVSVRGAGRGRTTITSPAAGSAVLVLTGERTEFRDVALTHIGRRAASVVTGGPTSSIVLTRARVSGARASGPASASGVGSGVSMTARQGEDRERGTTLEVTGTRFDGNDAAGILLSGAHRASIRRSGFRDNDQCAVCFTGASSGAVRDSTFTDNTVGVAVLGRARPEIRSSTFTGGEVAVQVSGQGAPVVRGIRVDRTARAGLIFGGTSRGRVGRVTCTRTPYGIVVTPKALPYLGANSCQVSQAS